MKKSKIVLGILFGILAIGLVSATLVAYLSNKVSEEVMVDSPLSLDGENFNLEIDIAGEKDLALVKVVNLAESDITSDFELRVYKGGVILTDTEGVRVAISEDINYCFSTQGDLTNVVDCELDYKQWVVNNPDWMDWYGTEDYDISKFTADYVINHGGNSFVNLGIINGIFTLPGLTIPAGETVYAVIYVELDPAAEPGTYEFELQAMA